MFRGSTKSNFGADWLSNARCGVQSSAAGMVHVGFSHIFDSMRQEIGRFVRRQIDDPQNPVQTIHCIGHSLGGAVATLAADWVKRTTRKHVELHTFGAPKPGLRVLLIASLLYWARTMCTGFTMRRILYPWCLYIPLPIRRCLDLGVLEVLPTHNCLLMRMV